MEKEIRPAGLASKKYETAIFGLQDALDNVAAWLGHHTAKTQTYRFVSSTEGLLALDEFSAWHKSASTQERFDIEPRKIRAFIYQIGRSNADLRAYSVVSASLSLQCIEVAAALLRAKRLSVTFAMLRAVIERTSVCHALIKQVAAILAQHENSFRGMGEAGQVITRALWGTKIDWINLDDLTIEQLAPKQMKYKPEKDRLDLTARQVLNAVDILNERLPGTRVTYELLCEFLHPNGLGDLFSITTAAKTFRDRFGTLHQEMEICRERADLSYSISNTMADAIRIAAAIVLLMPDVYAELKNLSQTFQKRMTKTIRHRIKKHRALFHRDDLCPCHSGKTVINCCGRPL